MRLEEFSILMNFIVRREIFRLTDFSYKNLSIVTDPKDSNGNSFIHLMTNDLTEAVHVGSLFQTELSKILILNLYRYCQLNVVP